MSLTAKPAPAARKVFNVHGHDEGVREAVARFMEKIGFEAVILHEKANQGRTVIEKVEAHTDVGFAIVLLTPDDEGCVKGGTLAARVRQNVLLELRYFLGKLTRWHLWCCCSSAMRISDRSTTSPYLCQKDARNAPRVLWEYE
jgi:predicted nucleotide-binding protein